MNIAVLALQGAFAEHEQVLKQLSVDCFEIRQQSDWSRPKDGLILPGGESTVMLKLLHELRLFEPVRRDIRAGLPVLGTCAGLILLSKRVEHAQSPFERLATMDISTARNAYGRQLGSFQVNGNLKGIDHPIPMTFIRAPYIKEAGEGVDILAQVDGRIVAARQGNQLVTAFHPELNSDPGVHQLFLDMVRASVQACSFR